MKLKDILTYVFIIIAVVLIRSFIITPIKVNGDSMVPTLKDGDLMLLEKYNKSEINRYEIVVVDVKEEKIIKRVIGLPKEDIEYKDGILYINDIKTEDKFGFGKTDDFKDYCGENEYFVMGDNREVSSDSRIIGCVDSNEIIGKTKLVIFPFNKWGNVK